MCTVYHCTLKQSSIKGKYVKWGIGVYFWFQTFAVFWMVYAFLWVISRCLNFICWHFGTLCLWLNRRSVLNFGIYNSDAGELSRRKHTTGVYFSGRCLYDNIELLSGEVWMLSCLSLRFIHKWSLNWRSVSYHPTSVNLAMLTTQLQLALQPLVGFGLLLTTHTKY